MIKIVKNKKADNEYKLSGNLTLGKICAIINALDCYTKIVNSQVAVDLLTEFDKAKLNCDING